MRKTLLAGVAGLALLLAAAPVQASPYDDQPGPGWQSADTLQSRLTSQGWQVREIKAEKGRYEVEGVDPQGRYVEAYYDPRTLQPTSMKVKSGSNNGYGKPKKDERKDSDRSDRGKDRGGKGKGGKGK
jgi:hypothetical protein